MGGMRYQPQGRVRLSREWRSQGLESFTLFQKTDIEAANASGLARVGSGHVPVATPFGIGASQNGGSNVWQVNAGSKLIGFGNQFAVAIAFRLNAPALTNRYLLIDGASGTQNAIIYGYTAGTVEFFAQGFTGTDPRTGSGILINDTLPHVIIYTYDGVTWRGFLDGVEKFAVTRTFSLSGGNSVGFIGGASAATNLVNATFFAHARFSRGLSRESARALSASLWSAFDAGSNSSTYLASIVSESTDPSSINGTLFATLDAAAISASAQFTATASLSSTLAGVSLNAAASVRLSAGLSVTLAPAQIVAAAAETVSASLAKTLAPATLSAAASSGVDQPNTTGEVHASLLAALAPATLSASGTIQGTASLAGQLAPVALAAYAGTPVAAMLSKALDGAVLSARLRFVAFDNLPAPGTRSFRVGAEPRTLFVSPDPLSTSIAPEPRVIL